MGGGGAERQLCYLCAEQVRAGFEVHVVLVAGGVNLARLQATGAIIHWLGPRIAYDPRSPRRLHTLCRQLRPDIVQAWMMPMDIYSGWVCPALHIPWILCERNQGAWRPEAFFWKPLGCLASWLRIRSACSAAAILANSVKGNRDWSARISARHGVIRNALPISELAQARPVPQADPFWPHGLRILCAGRFIEQKNWSATIDFLAQVLSRVDASVCICGRGPQDASIRGQITRLGLAERILIVGFRDDIWQLMKAADVFVSLSRFEGQPNVVLEAAACDCALVVSDIPEHREFLDDAQACFVDLGNPFSAVGSRIFTSADERRAHVQATRPLVESCRPAAMAAAYADQYQAILRGREP